MDVAKIDVLMLILLELWFSSPELIPVQMTDAAFKQLHRAVSPQCPFALTFDDCKRVARDLIETMKNLGRPRSSIERGHLQLYGEVTSLVHDMATENEFYTEITMLEGFDHRLHYRACPPERGDPLHFLERRIFPGEGGKISPVLLLNHGTFGAVYLARLEDDPKAYACKVYNINDPENCNELKFGTRFLQANEHHRNVCRFWSCQMLNLRGVKYGVTMMDLYHLSLHDVFVCNIAFTPQQKVQVLVEISRGLTHLVKMGIIHGDLKPANVMVKTETMRSANGVQTTDGFKCVIADFGNSIMHETVGDPYIQTVPFRAPEVLAHRPASFPMDVWSLGIIGLQLLKLNFLMVKYGSALSDIAAHICLYSLVFEEIENDWIQNDYVKSHHKRVQEDLKERGILERLFQERAQPARDYHYFKVMCAKMLSVKPETRITAAEIEGLLPEGLVPI